MFFDRIRELVALGTLSLWLALCLFLGGASGAGVLANATLQACSVLVILLFLWRLTTAEGKRKWSEIKSRQGQATTGIFLLSGAILLWIVLQLVPLPAMLWQNLGDRSLIIEGDKLLGLGDVARPLAIQPNAVLISAGWVLVPIATFLLTLRASGRARRYAGYTIVIVAILSAAIGAVQVAQGTNSRAYFYTITNFNTSVGFFANSNHLATLYLCALLICPWLFFGQPDRPSPRQGALNALGIAVIVLLFLNIIINRSVAGYILVIPCMAFVLMQHPSGREAIEKLPISARTFWFVLGIATLVIGWLIFTHLDQLLVGFTDPETRLGYYAKSLDIALANFPFGTGLGAFRWVYTGYEDASSVDFTYVNHAHNDYIEFFVEGGIIAVLFLVGFGLWLARRLRGMGDLPEWQLPLQFASAMVIGTIAAHSLVDYPGRTAAIAAIGAFAIANLASPPSRR